MRALMIVALIALAMPVAQASETTVDWTCYTMGDSNIYMYTLISGSTEDVITSFHVYAPCDYSLITSWTADGGWGFEATRDEESGGADLCWYSPTGIAGGLAADTAMSFTVETPASISTNEEYALPGCFGNWGYEVSGWAGGWPIMPSSVGVPQSFQPVTTPEPSSLIALASSLGVALGAMRRRKIYK